MVIMIEAVLMGLIFILPLTLLTIIGTIWALTDVLVVKPIQFGLRIAKKLWRLRVSTVHKAKKSSGTNRGPDCR